MLKIIISSTEELVLYRALNVEITPLRVCDDPNLLLIINLTLIREFLRLK
jgi:hypothetical protein